MMSISNSKNWYALSDSAIVREVGSSLRRMRLQRNLTQLEVAQRAGLDRITISKLENGGSATLLTLIQILRVLDHLEALSDFEEQPVTSPLQAARLQGKPRQRARGSRKPSAD